MNEKLLIENIIYLRKSKGYTQKQLSELLNYSDKVISKWERGESIPDIEILERLSILYKLSINELIGGEKIEAFLDVDKRRNIIYLTTSILVFGVYLLNFVNGNAETD